MEDSRSGVNRHRVADADLADDLLHLLFVELHELALQRQHVAVRQLLELVLFSALTTVEDDELVGDDDVLDALDLAVHFSYELLPVAVEMCGVEQSDRADADVAALDVGVDLHDVDLSEPGFHRYDPPDGLMDGLE